MLRNLQALRAFAALSVVFFHFSLVPASAMPWHYGSFGVDLFFVLSGFIIAYSATRDSRHFLAHRLIRVLPTYWIVTTLGAAICLLGMPALGVLDWWGQSLAFLTRADGRPPIIFVGWTLVYELAFYLIYSLALISGRKAAPYLAIALLLAVAFVPPLLVPYVPAAGAALLPWLRPWPLLVEFTYGLLIFLATQPLTTPSRARRWLGLSLTLAGLVLIYFFDGSILGLKGLELDAHRVAGMGLPAAAIVLGLVLMEKSGWSIKSRIVLALGAASYAIYLLHPPVFFFVLNLPPGPFQARLEVFAILTVATVLLSLGFYYAIEAPLLRLLRRWFTRDRPPAAASSSS
jgi:exopolysaccharide production protein ExoZ